MKQGYSHQFETAAVVIEPGENPLIEELIGFAHSIGAVQHNEEDGIDIVVDDQSGRYPERGIGAELFEEDAMREWGHPEFFALVS